MARPAHRPLRILVTGAGGPAAIAAMKSLRAEPSVELLAADMDPWAAGLYLVPPEARTLLPAGAALVEDETSLRDLTSRILTRHGYRVQATATGSKAIELARAPGQTVDLLLTDVVMPEMMGNEVAAAVRAIVPGVPALYMSGYAQPILDSHGVPALSIDILEKPFTEARLLARVRQALDAGAAVARGGSAELAGDERDGEVAFRPVTG